jgi:hypothetical protein
VRLQTDLGAVCGGACDQGEKTHAPAVAEDVVAELRPVSACSQHIGAGQHQEEEGVQAKQQLGQNGHFVMVQGNGKRTRGHDHGEIARMQGPQPIARTVLETYGHCLVLV